MIKKVLIYLLLVIVLSSFVFADILDNVKMAHKFDVNEASQTDSTGNGYVGTVVGATYDASGFINGAYSYDYSGDYISFNKAVINDGGVDGLKTITMWVYPTTTDARGLFAFTKDTTNYGYITKTATQTISFNTKIANSWKALGVTTNTLNTNEWNFIAMRFGADYIDVQINGDLETSITNGDDSRFNQLATWNAVGWGAYGYTSGLGAGWTGKIDEGTIWERILTDQELLDLYNSGSGLQYPFPMGKSDSSVSLIIDKASPQDYGTSITPRCNGVIGNGTISLKINNTVITNNTPQVLGAGTWLINCSMSGNDDYNPSQNTSLFVINKISPSISLSFSPSSVITVGTQSTVSGVGCPSQLDCGLYRDGVNFSNPNIEVLNIGVYNYVYNTSGNTNYTINSVTSNLTVINITAYRYFDFLSPTGDVFASVRNDGVVNASDYCLYDNTCLSSINNYWSLTGNELTPTTSNNTLLFKEGIVGNSIDYTNITVSSINFSYLTEGFVEMVDLPMLKPVSGTLSQVGSSNVLGLKGELGIIGTTINTPTITFVVLDNYENNTIVDITDISYSSSYSSLLFSPKGIFANDLAIVGLVGIGTLDPTTSLDVVDDKIRIRNEGCAGGCNQGDVAWNTTHICTCISTNTWKGAKFE